MSTPIWHPIACERLHCEKEVLASPADHDRGHCIAIIESFGYGWYATALPPQGDGTSSMLPGCVRGGNFGDRVEEAKAWCERIAGIHPERAGDRYSEPEPA